MIQISELQQDGIQKLIDGLKELLESQVFSIYGFDPETEIDILRNQVSNLSNDLNESPFPNHSPSHGHQTNTPPNRKG